MNPNNLIDAQSNKKINILICGCEGQLGNALSKTSNNKYRIFLTNKKNFDITNYNLCKKKTSLIQPKFIINAAAYTAVDLAEKNFKIAKKINTTGPKNLAKIAKELDSCLIHISTDYVFDGKKNSNYLETDKPNPLSIYGKTKLYGENEVRIILKKYLIIRISWLYGPNHKNFVTNILETGKRRKTLRIVKDQYGMPTYSYDLSKTIWNIIEKLNNNSINYGIFHYSSYGKAISRLDFSKAVFEYASNYGYIPPKIVSQNFSDLENSNIRPKFSCLNINKILKTFSIEKINWRESLSDMIKLYFSKKENNL